MFTAYDELQDVVDITKITKVTLNEVELDKEKTLELMKETTIDELLEDLTFWAQDFKINIQIDDSDFVTEIYFIVIPLKPTTKYKINPESLTETWLDPKTGQRLPLKTKSYLEEEKRKEEIRQKEIEEYNKKQYEHAKNRIETQLKEVEIFKFEPFTIIEGGVCNRCRYITLPESFPIPKSDYCVDNTEFYSNLEKTRKYVDFVGLAGMKDDKPQLLFRYALDSLKNHQDLHDLVDKALNENKFTPVIGISQESICRKDLDVTIQEIKEELINKYNK